MKTWECGREEKNGRKRRHIQTLDTRWLSIFPQLPLSVDEEAVNCKLGAVGILSFRPEISTSGGLSDDIVELGKKQLPIYNRRHHKSLSAPAMFFHLNYSHKNIFFKLLMACEYLHKKCEYYAAISDNLIQVSFQVSELAPCKRTHHPITVAVRNGHQVSVATASTTMTDKHLRIAQIILETTLSKVLLISWNTCLLSSQTKPQIVPPSS